MKDFMVEGKRYVFKDTLSGKDLADIPSQLTKKPLVLFAIVASRVLIEPKLKVAEVLDLPIMVSSRLAEIVNELYLDYFKIEE